MLCYHGNTHVGTCSLIYTNVNCLGRLKKLIKEITVVSMEGTELLT